MAKVTGPLLSFSGAGQIAKTQVYASWKGRQYARRYVIPANPKSDGQELTRAVFKYLFGLYRFASPGAIAAMTAAASSARLTTANMFPRANLSTMRAAIDNNNLVLSPGAGGAPVTPVFAQTPGALQISVDTPAPVLPAGWSAVPVVWAAAVKNWTGANAAAVGTDYTMEAVSQAVPAGGHYTNVITGLVHGVLYTVVNWYSVARPDGTLAYGVSTAQTGGPS